jgi:predicted ester cyclase
MIQKNKSLVRAYVDAMNKGDTSFLDQYCAPNYVYHGPNGDLDLKGFKEFHNSVLSAFPSSSISAEDMIAVGDKVVTRWKFRGNHQGEFQGIAPTGKDVTTTGIIISRFENGRVVEEWEEANLIGMMQQLGAIAPPNDVGP